MNRKICACGSVVEQKKAAVRNMNLSRINPGTDTIGLSFPVSNARKLFPYLATPS